MHVVMIGATGLVGSLAAPGLLAEGHRVDALLRRQGGPARPLWREQVAPPDEWPAIVRKLNPDAAVSALGTTMRQAGSQPAFRAVDLDMVVEFARAAVGAGARRMVTVSSAAADPGSANFYLRVKGEMEAALEGMGFERLDILQPGLLRGPRGGDRRLGERIGIALSPVVNLVLRGRLDRYAAIDADIVAAAVAGALRQNEAGVTGMKTAGSGGWPPLDPPCPRSGWGGGPPAGWWRGRWLDGRGFNARTSGFCASYPSTMLRMVPLPI